MISSYQLNIFAWEHRREAICFFTKIYYGVRLEQQESRDHNQDGIQAMFISAKVRDHMLLKLTDCPTVKSRTSHLVSTTRSIWKSDSCGVACVTRFDKWVLEIHSKPFDWPRCVLVWCRRNMWMFDRTSRNLHSQWHLGSEAPHLLQPTEEIWKSAVGKTAKN